MDDPTNPNNLSDFSNTPSTLPSDPVTKPNNDLTVPPSFAEPASSAFTETSMATTPPETVQTSDTALPPLSSPPPADMSLPPSGTDNSDATIVMPQVPAKEMLTTTPETKKENETPKGQKIIATFGAFLIVLILGILVGFFASRL